MASNASTDLYSENSLVKFKNELPTAVAVDGCKIALQSINLDNKYGNIPNGILATKNHFILFHTQGNTEQDVNPVASCTITDHDMTIFEFVEFITTNLKKDDTKKFEIAIINNFKRIRITLRNAVLLVHPQINSWLNFTTRPPIKFKGEAYFALSSKNVRENFSHVDFSMIPTSPSLIKVQLEQMCSNVSGVKLVQDLAILKVNPAQYPIDIVCKRKEYFEFNCNKLSTLSASLVDENNYPLHLSTGQPTFLKLQVKKFPMKSHVLRLSSLESSDLFSDNQNNNFQIQLKEPINFCEWDVALTSICLPTKIDMKRFFTPSNFYIILKKPNVVQHYLPLNDLIDFTPEGFVKHLNEKLKTSLITIDSSTQKLVDVFGAITFSTEEKNVHIFMSSTVEIKLSGLLAYLLHHTKTATSPTEPVVMKGAIKQLVLMGKLDFKRLYPHVIFLYCNFIKPMTIGGSFGQVLQMIPYYNGSAGGDEIMKYEAQHLDFLPLSMNDATMLHFEMRDASGGNIYFEDATQEILITLVFRKKT